MNPTKLFNNGVDAQKQAMPTQKQEQQSLPQKLVFSFASAYTAPVVLMSQNRQSEEDREKALSNHQINVQMAEENQRLHSKIDNLCGTTVFRSNSTS